jgi:hypothetical protein
VDIITPNEKTGRILHTSCTPTRGAGHALLHAQCFIFNKVQLGQSLIDIPYRSFSGAHVTMLDASLEVWRPTACLHVIITTFSQLEIDIDPGVGAESRDVYMGERSCKFHHLSREPRPFPPPNHGLHSVRPAQCPPRAFPNTKSRSAGRQNITESRISCGIISSSYPLSVRPSECITYLVRKEGGKYNEWGDRT